MIRQLLWIWYRRHRTLCGMWIYGEWQLCRKIIFELYSDIFSVGYWSHYLQLL